jgi:hypothetical protein
MADILVPGRTIFCNSESDIFFPGTAWSDAGDAELIRDGLETRNMPAGAAMVITMAVQTCNTPDAPDAAVALASSRTGDGLTFAVGFVDKTGTTGAKQYVRYGLLAKNAAGGGSTVRHAWAGGRIRTQKK